MCTACDGGNAARAAMQAYTSALVLATQPPSCMATSCRGLSPSMTTTPAPLQHPAEPAPWSDPSVYTARLSVLTVSPESLCNCNHAGADPMELGQISERRGGRVAGTGTPATVVGSPLCTLGCWDMH